MTEKQFKEHYLKILNGAAIKDFEEREKIFRTEIQALADIDGISFEEAFEKIESIFIDQYFEEDDEKVAEQLQMAASGLMMMEMLTEEKIMHGKIIKFKGDISDFKVKDGVVKIQLAADTQDVVLDQLNEISKGPLMINLEAS